MGNVLSYPVAPVLRTSTQQTVSFLDIPPEIRNMIYNELFPPGGRFTITQRMLRIKDEVPRRYAKPAPALRRHDIDSSWPKLTHTLGILGTNQQIRREVISVLNYNIRGNFDIMIAVDFKLIPPFVLALIDTVTVRRRIKDSLKSRYFLRFPNLTTARIRTRAMSQLDFGQAGLVGIYLDDMHSHEKKQYVDHVRACLNEIEERSIPFSRLQYRWFYETPRDEVVDYTPKSWKWEQGRAPVAIEIHLYLVNLNVAPGANPHGGVFVVYDFNAGKVTNIETRQFLRRMSSDIPDGLNKHVCSSDAWYMLESGGE